MGDISKDDLKTILLFALHIARVDEDFDPTEKRILARYVELVGLSMDELTGMKDAGRSLSSRLNSLSSEAARELLVKTLCAVAHADGAMHASEQAFLEKVRGVLGSGAVLPPFEQWADLEMEVMEVLVGLE